VAAWWWSSHEPLLLDFAPSTALFWSETACLILRFEGQLQRLSRPGRLGPQRRRPPNPAAAMPQGSPARPQQAPRLRHWQQPRRRQWKQGGWCGKTTSGGGRFSEPPNSASWRALCPGSEAQRSQLEATATGGAEREHGQLDSPHPASSRPGGAHHCAEETAA